MTVLKGRSVKVQVFDSLISQFVPLSVFAIRDAQVLANERPCCGTFDGSAHRSTCWKYKGKFPRK